MKKLLPLLILFLFGACNRSSDVIVADIYNKKLYLSEIQSLIPEGISKSDSTTLSEKIIEEWIKDQIILHEANLVLSAKKKNFDKEVNEFKNTLLINAYFNEITADSTHFIVTDEEVNRFLQENFLEDLEEKKIVKLSYIKLFHRSKVMKEIKEILFDEDKRLNMQGRIEELCADSIEYFIDDNTWLWVDDIQQELPINLIEEGETAEKPSHYEVKKDNHVYLIVLLDFRTNTIKGSPDEISSVRAMLIQQKKRDFINQRIEELYQAEKGSAIR